MHEGTVKIRRCKRTDFPTFVALLTPSTLEEANKVQERRWRRLAADPAHDCYVAEQDGTIQGILLVSYLRRLRRYGWEAILDMAVAPSAASDIGQMLLNFAKERARKRGCQRLLVCVTDAEGREWFPSFVQDGFGHAGEVLSCGIL